MTYTRNHPLLPLCPIPLSFQHTRCDTRSACLTHPAAPRTYPCTFLLPTRRTHEHAASPRITPRPAPVIIPADQPAKQHRAAILLQPPARWCVEIPLRPPLSWTCHADTRAAVSPVPLRSSSAILRRLPNSTSRAPSHAFPHRERLLLTHSNLYKLLRNAIGVHSGVPSACAVTLNNDRRRWQELAFVIACARAREAPKPGHEMLCSTIARCRPGLMCRSLPATPATTAQIRVAQPCGPWTAAWRPRALGTFFFF